MQLTVIDSFDNSEIGHLNEAFSRRQLLTSLYLSVSICLLRIAKAVVVGPCQQHAATINRSEIILLDHRSRLSDFPFLHYAILQGNPVRGPTDFAVFVCPSRPSRRMRPAGPTNVTRQPEPAGKTKFTLGFFKRVITNIMLNFNIFGFSSSKLFEKLKSRALTR